MAEESKPSEEKPEISENATPEEKNTPEHKKTSPSELVNELVDQIEHFVGQGMAYQASIREGITDVQRGGRMLEAARDNVSTASSRLRYSEQAQSHRDYQETEYTLRKALQTIDEQSHGLRSAFSEGGRFASDTDHLGSTLRTVQNEGIADTDLDLKSAVVEENEDERNKKIDGVEARLIPHIKNVDDLSGIMSRHASSIMGELPSDMSSTMRNLMVAYELVYPMRDLLGDHYYAIRGNIEEALGIVKQVGLKLDESVDGIRFNSKALSDLANATGIAITKGLDSVKESLGSASDSKS